jgi:hypothetical protein
MGRDKFIFLGILFIVVGCSPIQKGLSNNQQIEGINIPIWSPNMGMIMESKIYYIKNKKYKKIKTHK